MYNREHVHIFSLIRHTIQQGRQIYIVYPRIAIHYNKARGKGLLHGCKVVSPAFPNVNIGILHGKMKPSEQQEAMDCFVRGETKIVMATIIIGLGIDVPNATMMVIEDANHFGLAQLNQLRGRIRGCSLQSLCILVTDSVLTNNAKKCIETMLKTNNGFEIAAIDLRLRGAGNPAGLEQSGFPSLKLASFAKDKTIVQAANEASDVIINKDPMLEKEEHASIRSMLVHWDNIKKNWLHIS